MQATKIQEILKHWEGNTHKLSIGLDNWMADYEELSSQIGKDIFIDSEDTIIKLLIDHDISTPKMGGIVTAAWLKGNIDEDYVKTFNPKTAIRVGNGKQVQWIVQKSLAEKEIEGRTYTYQPYIGPMNFGKEVENNQGADVTQQADVKFFADVLTPQGIKNVKSYLTGSIITQIKNRLTQLKMADEDYKAAATQLKRDITKIVKELS